MELKEFVTDVLQQINDGIIEAQKAGVFVNPMGSIRQKDRADFRIDGTPCYGRTHNVDFEVGLTNKEGSGGGKIGVSFASIFSVDAEGGGKTSNSSVTRIRFSIPMLLPVYKSHEKD